MRNCYSLAVVALVALALGFALPALAQNGPYQYHAITPCRAVDTRCTTANPPSGTCSPPQAPLSGNTNTCSNAGSPCLANQTGSLAWTLQGNCGVPAGAKAVTINLTIVTPTAKGNGRIYPADAASMPIVSTINFAGGENALANGAIVPLGATTPDLRFYLYQVVNTGTYQAVVDITGYFCPSAGC